jgi:hypothetical protein
MIKIVGIFLLLLTLLMCSRNLAGQNLEGIRKQEPLKVSGAFATGAGFYHASGISRRYDPKDGPLTQEEIAVTFDHKARNNGRFMGKSGQFMAMAVRSIFTWTAGPDAGTTSETLGWIYAARE